MQVKARKKPYIPFLLAASLLSTSAMADVGEKLDNYFQGWNWESNVTSPQAYQGQAAGGYTGGSIFLRNQVKNYQIASVELPSFSGSCSGIDIFNGSMSFLSLDEALEAGKNILSNAKMYAFNLALAETVPQAQAIMQQMRDFIDKHNINNINTCTEGMALVGSLAPKLGIVHNELCSDLGSRSGLFTDWASAKQECGVGGKLSEGIGDGGDRQNEVIVDKNVVWDSLQQSGFVANDTELAELLMSLSGTVIIKQGDGQPEKTTKPSIATNKDFIRAIMEGGSAEIYVCDETDKCLNPTNKTITVSASDGLINKVTAVITKLKEGVVSDEGELTDDDKNFLEMTPIPVLKYITTNLSQGRAIAENDISRITAVAILKQYLTENLHQVRVAVSESDNLLTDDTLHKIREVEKMVLEEVKDSYQQFMNKNAVIRQIQSDEKQLGARIGEYASTGQEIG